MRKYILVFAALAALVHPASAQWQVPQYSVPIGKGAGQGFGSFGPCSAGGVPAYLSSSANPQCSSALSGVFTNTQHNYGLAALLGGLNPSSFYSGWYSSNHATEAVTGAIEVPSTATVFQANAVAGYVKSKRAPIGSGGDVAGFFLAEAAANNANVFSLNPVCVVGTGITGATCHTEFDFNINSDGSTVNGLSMQMSGTASTLSSAVAFSTATAFGTSLKWSGAHYIADRAIVSGGYALHAGAEGSGDNIPSSPILLNGIDSGGVSRTARVHADPNGVLVLRPGKAAAAVKLQDYNGASDIASFDTTGISLTAPITSGTWNGSAIPTAYGGLGSGFGAASGALSLSSGVASAGVLPAAFGGTGNAYFAVSGPATSQKTFTFPNASATVLTDNAAVTGAQGGTGVANTGKTITLGGDIITAGAFTTSGAYAVTLTVTGATSVTLPTSGTLATTAGASIPTLAQGDILYASGTNTLSALAKSTSSSRFLKNSGTSNNPAWAQPAASDLSDGTTGTGAVMLAASPTTTGTFTAAAINASGPLTISTTSPEVNLNKSASGDANNIWGRTGANARWAIAIGNNEAESGADAGSNFTFSAFSDAGGFLGNWLKIYRSTGVFEIASTVASTSKTTGSATFGGGIGVAGAAYIGGTLGVPGGSTAVFTSTAAITSGAGASTGTLTNAPAAGNPTKWIPINDNGTTRYIPAW
jgi:hypothetical protein